jgi:hypothetical protein
MDIGVELSSKWREAAMTARGGHEWRGVLLSIAAPVRLLAAVREPDDRLTLLLEGPVSAAPASRVRFEAHGLSLTDQRRSDEKLFRLALTLERSELEDVFEALCADLISVALVSASAPAAFGGITKRLEAWQACLRARKAGLSQEEQTGLLGELTALKMIAETAGYLRAVQAWKGPLDGIHDFEDSGLAIEVKSVLGIGTYLHISRIDQLEFAGLSQLVIARLRFRQGQDGEDLPSYVNRVRAEIVGKHPASLAEFEDKLLRAGYLDIDSQLYRETLFMQEGFCCYSVDHDFPRLLRQEIPAAIVDGSYTIDERAISQFKKSEAEFRQTLNKNLEKST